MEFPATWEGVPLILLSLGAPQWANVDKTAINVMANFEETGVIPFTASKDDSQAHGVAIFEYLSGLAVAPYERPEVTVEDLQKELDKIWPDVVLGIATEEEISLAKALRIQIKAMS